MFIIKWINLNKNQIYYTYPSSLFGAHCDVYPYMCDYYIGYVNYHGHEILDINYVFNNKVWTYEDYKSRICFAGKKKIKNIILDNVINLLTKLNKQ